MFQRDAERPRGSFLPLRDGHALVLMLGVASSGPSASRWASLRLRRVLEPAQAAVELVEATVDAVGVGLDAFDLVTDASFKPGETTLDPLQPAGVIVKGRLHAVELGVEAAQQMKGVAFRFVAHSK